MILTTLSARLLPLIAAAPAPTTPSTTGSITTSLSNLQILLLAIGTAGLSLAFIGLGIRLLIKFKAGDALREAFQGVGVLFVAAFLIGGASALGGIAINTGNTISGTATSTTTGH